MAQIVHPKISNATTNVNNIATIQQPMLWKPNVPGPRALWTSAAGPDFCTNVMTLFLCVAEDKCETAKGFSIHRDGAYTTPHFIPSHFHQLRRLTNEKSALKSTHKEKWSKSGRLILVQCLIFRRWHFSWRKKKHIWGGKPFVIICGYLYHEWVVNPDWSWCCKCNTKFFGGRVLQDLGCQFTRRVA